MNFFKPTSKDILGVIEMLRASNCLPRWSAHLQNGYTEVAKQALNCQIASIMFELVANEGHAVDFSLLPRIALYRGFEKYEKCDITEESYAELFNDDSSLEKGFLTYLNNKVIKMTSTNFVNYISGLDNTFEMKIYKASTAIATTIEALEIKNLISPEKYAEIEDRQNKRLKRYADFPIVRDILSPKNSDLNSMNLFKMFQELSCLRNRIRWVKRAPLRDYSVLGHSYDVAVLNYLFCLNEFPEDPKKAEIGFYVGLYHDIAENWTGDMPSPIKDAVPGLRAKTEAYECQILEKNVFPHIPEWLIPKFKGVMMEFMPDRNLRDYYKVGDGLAATIEASSQLMAGSHNKYFSNVVISDFLKNKGTKTYKDVLNHVRKDAGINYFDVALFALHISKRYW